MSDLQKKVLEKIKKGEVKMRPRWQFVLVHVILWAVVVLAIFLGSVATGAVLREFFYAEWEFVPHLGGGRIRGFLMVLPYFWIGSLVLIVLLSSWLFKKTKKGYRFKSWMIVLGAVLASVIIGTGMFFGRVADRVEDVLFEHVGPYASFKEFRDKVWLDPEEGVLSGKIVKVEGDEVLMVDDVTGKRWKVEVEEMAFEPEVGMPIIARGEKVGEDEFDAEYIQVRKKHERPLPFFGKQQPAKPRKHDGGRRPPPPPPPSD